MATYPNGLVPRSVMKQFRSTGKYGHPVFIDHLEKAFQECERAGIHLFIASGQDIFRDFAGQLYWKSYWSARGKPGNAATPGQSNHGLGICADVSGTGPWGSKTWQKVSDIFQKHQISFTVRSEEWHVQDMSIKTNGFASISITPSVVTPSKGAYSGNPHFPSTAAFAAVQGGYNALGYGLVKDGLSGPSTAAATRDFQRKHGLVVDGVHGPGTEKKLIEVVAAKRKADAAKPKPIGEVVKDQQRRLNVWRAATPPLVVDGIPGPRFKAATLAFQKAHRLGADGIIGPKTWAKLQTNPPR